MRKHRGAKFLPALAVLLLLSAPQPPSAAEENIFVLAMTTPPEAISRLLTMSRSDRERALAALFNNGNPRCRQVAVRVVEQTYAVKFVPVLKSLLAGEKNPQIRERYRKLIERLELYQKIAFEEDDVPPAPADRREKREKKASDIFKPVTVRVQVLTRDGRPAAGCGAQAFSDDYGVRVPYRELQKLDDNGCCELGLFPGKWTFFAAGGKNGSGIYVCQPGKTIEDDTKLTLKPDKSMTLKFGGMDMNDVRVVDSAFAGFLECVSLGETAAGAFNLGYSGGRSCDTIAFRQPAGGAGFFCYKPGLTRKSRVEISTKKTRCGCFKFELARGGRAPKSVEVKISVRSLPNKDITFKASGPFSLYVTPGEVEMSYALETKENRRLAFSRKAYKLSGGNLKKITFGGEYAFSVFHQYYKKFAGRKNVLAYYLFVKDVNGHYLSNYWKISGRRRKRITIPIKVTLDKRVVFDTGKTKPDRQFMSEAGWIRSEADLERVSYEVDLGLGSGKRTLGGHGLDYTKESKHFRFVGVHELAHTAESWLKGSEAIYEIFCKMLDMTPRWRTGKTGKADIRFRVKMPPGVGAYGGGHGMTFTIGSGLSVTQPWRILRVPLRHELLHTFGHSHRDFMHITCQEAGVRFSGDAVAARFKGNKPQNDEILRCRRGEKTPKPEAVVDYVLLAHYGYQVFKKYVETAQAHRDKLQAEGLTETEGDCAIFSALTRDEALSIYRAAGVRLNEEAVERGIKLLRKSGGRKGSEVARKRPPEQLAAAQAVQKAAKAFERGDPASAEVHVQTALKNIPAIGDYRTRTWFYCRLAELYLKDGQKEKAYEMFRETQRAASKVDAGYLRKIRGICVNTLKGEAILRINFF